MAGNEQLILDVGGNFAPITQQINNFARSAKPINVQVNANGLGQISRQASEFERSMAAAQSRVLAFGFAAGQIYLVARAFDQLIKTTIDVQKELTDINVVLNLSSSQLAEFSKKLFATANLTGKSFKEAADTALEFSRQGLGTQEVLKRTADSLNLTRISTTDLQTAIKAITATLNTFNEVGLDSTVLLNKIATVDTRFAVSGNVIAESLIRVSAIAEDTNISFDKLVGMITALQQTTSRGGAVIGTALGSIFQRVERPQVLEQLSQLGIATEDLAGNALSADKVLTNLAKTYNTLSDAQKNNVTQLVSGMRQANQFKALMADLGNPNSITGRASDVSAGSTDQALRRQLALNQTLAAQFNQTKNNLTQLASEIGNISIAPALHNIFKTVDLVTDGDSLSKQLGEGLLKGLGNYLSGPGLALGGTLIIKFFTQFASFAAKSLATIIENSSNRIQQEAKIDELLAKQPELMEKIATAGGDVAKIQQIITQELLAQNAVLNARASNISAVGGLVQRNDLSFSSEAKPFILNNKGGLSNNVKFSPNLSALSDAIDRERRMGVNPTQIRVGSSNLLVSPDNPLGMGIYNTKDEPAGINQGIQRVIAGGGDPRKAGIIPSFAANYYQDIPSTIKDPFNRPPGNMPLGLQESIQLEQEVSKLKEQIKIGTRSQESLSQAADNLKKQFNLTSESTENINKRLQLSLQNFQSKTKPFSSSLSGLTGQIDTGQLGFNFSKPSSQGEFLSIINQTEALKPNPLLGTSTILSPEYLTEMKQKAALQNTQFAESKLNQLNLFDATLGRFGSKYRGAIALGQETAPASLAQTRQRLAGQGLMGSFIAPLIAGEAQQGFGAAFGQNSTATRGTSAAIGAVGNIASYALGGMAFGPWGAPIGAGIGALMELPKVFKSFSDTLPDLQRNLERIKDSTSKVNDAFAGYLTTTDQLSEIQSGKQTVSVGQYNQLLQKQNQNFINLPQEAQYAIRKNPADAYSIASNYTSLAQQNISSLQDIIALKNAKASDFLPVLKSQSEISKTDFSNLSIRKPVNNYSPMYGTMNIPNIQTEINPTLKAYANSILGFQNSSGTSLDSLLRTLSPDKTKGLNTSNLTQFLQSNGFDNQIINNSQGLIAEIQNKKDGGAYLNQMLSPEGIKQRADDAKTLQVAGEEQAKKLSELNTRIANLTITGTEAIGNFEINVINKLSKSLTQLKLNSISQDTAAKISEINSGNNSYNKNYFDYIRQNSASQNQYGEGVQRANSSFTNKTGNDFYSVIDNYTKDLKQKGNISDLGDMEDKKRGELNNILKGYFNIDKDFSVTASKSDFSPQDISGISSNINNKIKELDNAPTSINGVAQDTKETVKLYQDLLEKLTKNSADLKKNLQEAQNNLDSNIEINYKQLLANFDILGAQFKTNESNNIFSSSLDRQFSANAFNLSRKSSISNPIQAIQYGVQAQSQSQIAGILNNLNTDTGLGITNPNEIQSQINKQKSFTGPLTLEQSSKQQGIIESLVKAYDDYNKILDDNQEKVNQEIQSLSNFTDIKAQVVRQRNINGADQGTLTGGSYVRAALSPLQYNSQTFQRDAITGIQDFSEVLKSSLSDNLLNVTRGAQNASEALRDLGLSLAENLAKKFSDIGINALFGAGVSALSNSFPSIGKSLNSANGGYIPRFAHGGFVNMGSGIKDDVPAFLSGGEFVLNKRAVQKIGKHNLNTINNIPDNSGSIVNDSINLSPNSINIGLANSFELNGNGRSGSLNVSSLLSGIGQIDQNNPQNKLKFGRELYAFNRKMAYRQYQKQLNAYNVSQYIQLGQAYLGAAGSVLGAFGGETGPSAANVDSETGVLPISQEGGYGTAGIMAKGGYIPKFANGGYFGGDSSSDKFRAMVMGGEYIVSPKTVNKYGANYFKGLNDTGKYASGGSVSSTYNPIENDTHASKIINALGEIRDKLSINNSPVGNSTANNSQTNHVTINVTVTKDGNVNTQDSSSSSNGNNQNSIKDREALQKTSELIRGHVIKELTQQSRIGGLLYNTFASKRT